MLLGIMKPKLLQMIREISLLLTLTFIFTNSTLGQTKQFNIDFDWSEKKILIDPITSEKLKIHAISDGHLKKEHAEIPVYSNQFKVNGNTSVNVEVNITKKSSIEIVTEDAKASVSNSINVWTKIEKHRNEYYLTYGFIPTLNIRYL